MDVDYADRTRNSRAIYERLLRVFPNGETRAVAWFAPYPVVIDRGKAAHVWDIDGNEYIDLLNNYTALVHGHANPYITQALTDAAWTGTVHPAPHRSQLALAEHIANRYPGVEQVRFTNSGSEAAILAARLAFRATGRSKLVLIDGGYHGTGYLFADPNPHVMRVPYNDIEAMREAIDDTTAAVFIEPFLGSAGVIPASETYLKQVAGAARRAGALFVLDEIQALRWAFHGANDLLGLDADLVLMGKIIGGGLPVGAVGGRASILHCISAETGPSLKHSGTFNGNVATMAAGFASMQLLTNDAIAQLNNRASRLIDSVHSAARASGLTVSLTSAGSIFHVHFLADAPRDAAQAREGRHELNERLHRRLLVHGVYTAPRGMANLSTALTDADLAKIASAYEEAFADVADYSNGAG